MPASTTRARKGHPPTPAPIPTIPCIGCDIGTTGVHIAVSSTNKPKFIAFDGDWTAALADLVPAGAYVALEPTGWHYSAPIIEAFRYLKAQILIVNNATTGNIRKEIQSVSKTDDLDARTLSGIAQMFADGVPLKHVHPADISRISAARTLRMLIHAHACLTRERIRSINRLRQLAFSVAPICAQSFETWLRCAQAGYPDADGILYLATNVNTSPGFEHGNSRKSVRKLAEALPVWADGHDMRIPVAIEVENLNFTQPRQESIENRIAEIINGELFGAVTTLWKTVPGASDIRIGCILTACNSNPTDYTSNDFLAAIGGQPKFAQSGKRQTRDMNIAGFRPARSVATLWALNLISPSAPNNPLKATAQRLERQNKKIRPRIRAQLINILWGIAKNGTPYRFVEAK